MRVLVLLPLLVLLGFSFCCCRAADSSSTAEDPPGPEAFISRRASAEAVLRQKRNYIQDGGTFGTGPDPLEVRREVCELNPSCDELGDRIGFPAAYQRFYGPL
ncbi:osteocalcin [Calypte anna]|uniref:osteocalcin n=1 Tax=Calypte anna TaxID=9244 RepID=UPI0011C49113|nr:osteocalcin [Calypte anna]